MKRCVLLLAVILAARGGTGYELRGRLVPGTRASVSLHGATAPFEDGTLADDEGRFRFRDLAAGAYTLAVFVPGRGEIRRTIDVGPSQADARQRIELTVDLRGGQFESRDSLRRTAVVSARELAIPEQARREYEEAGKRLAKRDAEGATVHLQRAVEIAPQFAAAWNHLGTIAYQTRNFPRAESCFRKALDADRDFFQAVVNLGGVLINLSKFDEALQYNLYATLSRPSDALANSQLGMTYFYLDKLDMSNKYLTIAKQLDPAHFSHPQLILAQIDLRRHDRAAAAGELEAFLQNHPDSSRAAQIKEDITRLRADPAQAFAATGMARSFSEIPDLPLASGEISVLRHDGRCYLAARDAGEPTQEKSIDGVVGSGRHARVLLNKSAGGWAALPIVWYPDEGGRYATNPGFVFSADCLACHAAQKGDSPEAINCARCHGTAGSGKPGQEVCMQCHPETSGPNSAHFDSTGGQDKFELNSAAYRLLQSRCYQGAAAKLTCTTCHPPHTFSKTSGEYRMVCRGCHPAVHNAAPLDCIRCHMPKRRTDDAGHMLVTDHRIQRPL